MKLHTVLSAVGMVFVASASLAEDAPTAGFLQLLKEGYLLKATGVLVTRRELIEALDEGIIAHTPPRPSHTSCDGEFVVTIHGAIEGCGFRDVFVNRARFYRLSKGSTEFVCIRGNGNLCHLVH